MHMMEHWQTIGVFCTCFGVKPSRMSETMTGMVSDTLQKPVLRFYHFAKATFQKPARQKPLFKSLRVKSHFSKACASKATFQKPTRQKSLFKSLRIKSQFSKACVSPRRPSMFL